jgi:hypothetical protein
MTLWKEGPVDLCRRPIQEGGGRVGWGRRYDSGTVVRGQGSASSITAGSADNLRCRG